MLDRRTLLKSGAALAVALPGAAALARLAGGDRGAIRLERFVFDERFTAARETARHIEALGVPLAAAAGDLTQLWYDDLDLRWKRAPMALAGVTTRASLFVLETLAANRGMRLAYRGEHGVAIGGVARHRLVGPAELVDYAARSPIAALWGAPLAHALAGCRACDGALADVELTGSEERSGRDEALYSWLIAPRRSVAFSAARVPTLID